MGAPGCAAAERQPTLPDTEREESVETSGESDAAGALVDSVKRSGWVLSSGGRCERRERRDDALRARIVLEYSIGRAARAPPVAVSQKISPCQ